jgi:hypothetical protein
MSKLDWDLVWGIVSMAIGALILLNLPVLVQFDQSFVTKLRAWSRMKFGNSILNRELWPSAAKGTPSAVRGSRICFQITATILLAGGFVIVVLYFWL